MKLYKKLNHLRNPKFAFIIFLHKISRIFPDKFYVRMLFRIRMGYSLDLNNVRTFNEKLQWLKLYNKDPLAVKLVDKYEVKKHVENIIGKEYIIKTYGVWNSFDEINFEELPNSFVLKCTHDSGGLVICDDKCKLDYKAVKYKLNKCLKRNYFYPSREWPYKDIEPRIIAEQYIPDESGTGLEDYKFFCFDGDPKLLYTATNRLKNVNFDYFDLDFNPLKVYNGHNNSTKLLSKPKNYNKMIEIAKALSYKFPHVRVDLYNVNGKIYFGELTFFHLSGLIPFKPKSFDVKLGDLLKLPRN